jgi:serine protease Do
LTLLKVEAKGLPVQPVVPKKDIKEGQWSIALGRALDLKMDKAPAISLGVISALNRVWGKAIQTDAKISPVNYGGPIIDLEGRMQGILIPASPKGDDEISGFEWYDSGIGFAIPMEDVMTALPRLKEGKDLQKGILGVAMKSQDQYSTVPVIGTVAKASPAEKAGLKPGDTILEIEGKKVVSMAQIQHILGTKYEGDRIALKYQRDGKPLEIKALELVGKNVTIAQGYFGILPMRDDPVLGVDIRGIYEKGPAEKAGLKPGDRIVKYGDEGKMNEFKGEKSGRNELFDWLNSLYPGAQVKVEVKRKAGKVETVAVTLGDMPGSMPGAPIGIPEKLPEPATFKKALAPLELNNPNIKNPKVVEQNPPKHETGFLERNTPDGEMKYWLYVHEDYDPNVAHAMVVWLHPPEKNTKEDLEAFYELWEDYCKENHIVLVMPIEKQGGWSSGMSDGVVAAARETMKSHTIDRQRVVAHGMGVGGQMAFHLGFNHRDVFRGVSAIGATATGLKDNLAQQRLSFYLAAGELDPLHKAVAESRVKLAERRFPAYYRQIPERGREYLERKNLAEVVRWIDSLDLQ